MKRIMRKHLNDSIDIDTRFGLQTVACKIHKGLAVTASLNPNVPGYRVTHVATGKIVSSYVFKLNRAWSVLLALAPLTDWTQTTVESLAAAVSLSPKEFHNSVCSIVNRMFFYNLSYTTANASIDIAARDILEGK